MYHCIPVYMYLVYINCTNVHSSILVEYIESSSIFIDTYIHNSYAYNIMYTALPIRVISSGYF